MPNDTLTYVKKSKLLEIYHEIIKLKLKNGKMKLMKERERRFKLSCLNLSIY